MIIVFKTLKITLKLSFCENLSISLSKFVKAAFVPWSREIPCRVKIPYSFEISSRLHLNFKVFNFIERYEIAENELSADCDYQKITSRINVIFDMR